MVRHQASHALYIAKQYSEGIVPAAGSSVWEEMLSTGSGQVEPCPEGMARLPNAVCMDASGRRVTSNSGYDQFSPVHAMELCRQAGARLCDTHDLYSRALCVDRPDLCDNSAQWRTVGDLNGLRCFPVIFLPDGALLYHENPLSSEVHDAPDVGGYLHIRIVADSEPKTMRVQSVARGACTQAWRQDGFAEYLCCKDPS